jgi:Flp pilus assembly protein TadG
MRGWDCCPVPKKIMRSGGPPARRGRTPILIMEERDMFVRLRKFVQGTEGTIMVFSALGLVAFLGFASLAIDMGHLYVVRNELQNVADAAALAGAAKLIENNNGVAQVRSDLAQQAALGIAQSQAQISGLPTVANGARNDLTIAYGNWNAYAGNRDTAWTEDPSGTAANDNAVRVSIRRADGVVFGPVTNLLAGILGQPTSAVAATATAYLGFVGNTQYGSVTLPMVLPNTVLRAADRDSNSWWAQWLGPREAIAAATNTLTFKDLGTDYFPSINAPTVQNGKIYLVRVLSSDAIPGTLFQNLVYASSKAAAPIAAATGSTPSPAPVSPIKVNATVTPISEYAWAYNNKAIFGGLKAAFDDKKVLVNGKYKWRVLLPVTKTTGSADNGTNQGLWRLAQLFSFGPSPAYACYTFPSTIQINGFASADFTAVNYNSSCIDCSAGDINCFNNANSCRNTNSATVDISTDSSSLGPPGTNPTGGQDDNHLYSGGPSGNGVMAATPVLVQ